MLDVSSPEALFGKDAVGDRKTLRRAYAKLIKRFRPETSPDEFAQIHELYQAALKRLKGEKENRLADMAPPIDPEAMERQTRARLDDLPPPKWRDADRPPERDQKPEREDAPPPEWERADRGPEREAPPPEWERADRKPEREDVPPQWERADRKPEREDAPPQWERVDRRKKPDEAPPDWKRLDGEDEGGAPPPDRKKAEPERERPPEDPPEWQQRHPDRRPIAPEDLEVEAEAAAELRAAIDEAWGRILTDPDAAVERFKQLAEAAPHAPYAWLAWAAASSTRDQAPPREALRAAMRSPARDLVVAFLVDLADQSPAGFFAWMDADIIQAASRAEGFGDLVEQWWMMTLAFGKPKAIQTAARAITDLPVRFDAEFIANLVCDAAENAFWAGRGPWLQRWRAEVHDTSTSDPELVRRLDAVSWLLEYEEEVTELLLHEDLMPVVEFLRTAWTLPDELLRGPWQRHLVGLREHGAELDQVAVDMNALAPGLCEIYLGLLKRVPLHLSDDDHDFLRGWLQRQEHVIDQHPLRIWYHVKLWPVYLAVLAAGLIMPPLLFLAIPVYRIAENKLRYKLYNDHVRRAFAHLCRTHGYARLEVLHVLSDTRAANLHDMRHTLEQDISIDIEGATVTRNR